MAFTFDRTATSGNDMVITQLRGLIGDTREGYGPRPNAGHAADPTSGNFDDNDYLAAYDIEGSHLWRTAAHMLEVLANEWSAFAGSIKTGPKSESHKQADAFAARAEKLRNIHGRDDTSAGFSLEITR